ncbi:MAG: NnrU family protein, partial [Pseudomonadota bacterium]
MAGGLVHIAFAGLALIITHYALSLTALRGALIGRLGEGPYKGLHSLVSLGALVWLWWAYRTVSGPSLWWESGSIGLWLPMVLVPISFIMMAASGMAKGGGQARGLHRVTRHPMLWGVVLWAVSHIVANGMANEVLFFGAFVALAVVGGLVLDHRNVREGDEAYRAFHAEISNIPFAAVLDGRQRLGPVLSELGWKPVVAGLVVSLVFIGLHPYLFGV